MTETLFKDPQGPRNYLFQFEGGTFLFDFTGTFDLIFGES